MLTTAAFIGGAGIVAAAPAAAFLAAPAASAQPQSPCVPQFDAHVRLIGGDPRGRLDRRTRCAAHRENGCGSVRVAGNTLDPFAALLNSPAMDLAGGAVLNLFIGNGMDGTSFRPDGYEADSSSETAATAGTPRLPVSQGARRQRPTDRIRRQRRKRVLRHPDVRRRHRDERRQGRQRRDLQRQRRGGRRGRRCGYLRRHRDCGPRRHRRQRHERKRERRRRRRAAATPTAVRSSPPTRRRA